MRIRDDARFRAEFEAHNGVRLPNNQEQLVRRGVIEAERRAAAEAAGRRIAAERAAAFEAAAAARRAAAEAEAARRAAEAEARRAAEAAARRAEKIAKRDRHLARIASIGPVMILDHAKRIMEIWQQNNIPGLNIPKAYVALCYFPQTHAAFTNLITAAVNLRFQAFDNHPDFKNYRDVPEEERATVLEAIRASLGAYEEFDLHRIISDSDPWRSAILRREQLEAEQERARLAALAEAARRAAFQAQLREAPVVFQRDPEGGINLRAFAADTQSVHRSSVQNSTHKAVVALLARPMLEGVNSLEEAVASFGDPARVRWWANGATEAARTAAANAARDLAITELTNDYFNTEAFNVRYGDVLDRVWTFIRGHEHHNELCTRLAQETFEGRGMCSNGKMARLVNVLMGYDDTLMTEAPREVFQFRIAALMKRPLAEREAEARALFTEFSIPEAEQDAWLEPLLEPEEASSGTGGGVGGGAAAAAAT